MDRRSEIERLAYELYERSGCAHGHAEEHWLQAEIIINSRQAGSVPAIIPQEKVPGVKKIVAAKAVAAEKKPKKGRVITKGKTQEKAPLKAKKGRTSQKEATL